MPATKITNASEHPIDVTRVTLKSSSFASPLVWAEETASIVLPGQGLDLRVTIPKAVCDAAASGASVVAESSDDPVSLVPSDPYDLVERLRSEACHASDVAAIATPPAHQLISPPSLPAPAELVVSVQPTGANGVIVLESIRGTTLLSPSGDTGGVAELVLNQSISAQGPSEICVPLVPNRCDAHALTEDKVGTRMPLVVTAADGTAGRITLAASDT